MTFYYIDKNGETSYPSAIHPRAFPIFKLVLAILIPNYLTAIPKTTFTDDDDDDFVYRGRALLSGSESSETT